MGDPLELQVAEIELLESSFPDELKIESPENFEELKKKIEQGENVQLGLVYSINMTSYKLWISIPDLYPKIAPTIMITTKECNDKDFQLELEKVVTEIVSRESDELVIMEVNDWVIENFEKFKEKAEPVKTVNKNAEVEFIRLWIYSHHIY